MHVKARPLINPHRFARLIAWAQLALVYAVGVLFGDGARVKRRHIRQRYDFLERVEQLVRGLVLIRVVEGLRLPRHRHSVRSDAACGFRRRLHRGGKRRAVMGARLRRAFRDLDPAARISRLMAALADIDAFAARFAKRLRNGMTRVNPICIVASVHEACAQLATLTPSCADSS